MSCRPKYLDEHDSLEDFSGEIADFFGSQGTPAGQDVAPYYRWAGRIDDAYDFAQDPTVYNLGKIYAVGLGSFYGGAYSAIATVELLGVFGLAGAPFAGLLVGTAFIVGGIAGGAYYYHEYVDRFGPGSPSNATNGSDPAPGCDDSESGLGAPFDNPSDTPIVLDLDGDGVELISLDDSTTQFDIDADGFAELTGWVKPDDGLLAIDLNSDGNINSRDELFGVDASTDGFEVLTGYDSNSDNAITSADAQFGALRVWRDLDGNGIVSDGELQTLSAAGITSISLNDTSSSQVIEGHDVLRASTFVIGGQTRAALDVLFNVDQTQSYYILDENFVYDTDVFALPQLRGFGDIPDLWVAMTQDSQLLQIVQDLTDGDYSSFDYADFKNDVQDMMFRWTGVHNVDPGDRGDDIDARVIEGAEKWLGITSNETLPGNNQAELISSEWSQLVDAVATRLLIQIPTQPFFAALHLATTHYKELIENEEDVESYTDEQWDAEFASFLILQIPLSRRIRSNFYLVSIIILSPTP